MITNCPRCGKLFMKTTKDICEQCISEERELIDIIRLYLKENKMATITDVVRDTDIELEIILDFIEKGHIILIDNPNIKFECSRCGNPTQDGHLCSRCREELILELADATQLVRSVRESTADRTKVVYHSFGNSNRDSD
jgi:flagellar operon protein (TIGR03826 family)